MEPLFSSTVVFDEDTLTAAYGSYFAHKRKWIYIAMLGLAAVAVGLGVWCLRTGQITQAVLCALVAGLSVYRVFFANNSLVRRSAAANGKPDELALFFYEDGLQAGRGGAAKREQYTDLTLCLLTGNLALLEFEKRRLLVVDLTRFTEGASPEFLEFIKAKLPDEKKWHDNTTKFSSKRK